MFFQKMSVPVQSTVTVSSFLGLDRRARGELGSFREMENLTSDGYPTLTVRPRRGLAGQVESPGGIAAKDALIWVDGHTLYVGGVATELVLTEGSKQLIGMGNWLIVWPDKKYINTGDLSRYGSLENRVQTQGQVTLSLCGAKGAALGDYLASEEPPTDPAGGCLWLDTAGEVPVLRQYGESGWSIREDTYIKIAAGGIGVGFAAGGGVAKAVEDVIHRLHPEIEVKTVAAEGLNECRQMLRIARTGKYAGYLLEGMACPGGCIAGAGTVQPPEKSRRLLEQYKAQAPKSNPVESDYTEYLQIIREDEENWDPVARH